MADLNSLATTIYVSVNYYLNNLTIFRRFLAAFNKIMKKVLYHLNVVFYTN